MIGTNHLCFNKSVSEHAQYLLQPSLIVQELLKRTNRSYGWINALFSQPLTLDIFKQTPLDKDNKITEALTKYVLKV